VGRDHFRTVAAGQRVMALYSAWGKDDQTATWRARLASSGDED
jgi:hypothetical protein